MSHMNLRIEPLTAQAFAPFGDVIEVREGLRHFTINGGSTERYHDLAHIDPGENGKAIVSIFRGQPRTMPFVVTMMERHPKASQAFVPLSGLSYLVVVAPAGDPPRVEDLRVFACRSDQGVNYARGVWHHPLLALDAVSDFLVIDRSGEGHNCDEIQLESTGLIEWTRVTGGAS
jgi:ureidoglycolate lyase